MSRKPYFDAYEIVHHRPETISELIGDYCTFKKMIHERLRAIEQKSSTKIFDDANH